MLLRLADLVNLDAGLGQPAPPSPRSTRKERVRRGNLLTLLKRPRPCQHLGFRCRRRRPGNDAEEPPAPTATHAPAGSINIDLQGIEVKRLYCPASSFRLTASRCFVRPAELPLIARPRIVPPNTPVIPSDRLRSSVIR